MNVDVDSVFLVTLNFEVHAYRSLECLALTRMAKTIRKVNGGEKPPLARRVNCRKNK